jgi:hypothetical protein
MAISRRVLLETNYSKLPYAVSTVRCRSGDFETYKIEYFGTLIYTTPTASNVSTRLPYIRTRLISAVLNLLQCAPSTANIPSQWKGISLTIYCFPSLKVGSTERTNQVDKGVKQCSQISSPINTLYKVVSHQNEPLP